ncbi:MAG: hypothetical protein ACYT04_44295 [Nostoc sp.]
MIITLYLYAQITAAFIVFFWHKQNSAFVRTAIYHSILATILLSFIQYGSAYSLDWDYSRWQWSNEFQIFPLRGQGGLANANTIAKNSFFYWFFTMITTFLYVAFPQSVLIAENHHLRDSGKPFLQILRKLKKIYRIGIGFFSTAIVLSSLVSPVPSGNKIVMLIAYGVLILWLGSRMWEDIGDGIQGYIPNGKETVDNLKNFANFIRLLKR